MALLLALDTATKHCAVALADDGRLLMGRAEESDRYSHAERLNVLIDEVMKDADRSLNDLAAVAVGIGPGSYTGLRIGLSAAKGLCFALDLPLIGMGTLDVLCAELRSSRTGLLVDDILHPMIDARRMEVFTKTANGSDDGQGFGHALVLDLAWVDGLITDRRHVVFGDGADKALELWSDRAHVVHIPGIRPSVAGLAACAHSLFERGQFADLAYLVPEYGKEANVTWGKR